MLISSCHCLGCLRLTASHGIFSATCNGDARLRQAVPFATGYDSSDNLFTSHMYTNGNQCARYMQRRKEGLTMKEAQTWMSSQRFGSPSNSCAVFGWSWQSSSQSQGPCCLPVWNSSRHCAQVNQLEEVLILTVVSNICAESFSQAQSTPLA